MNILLIPDKFKSSLSAKEVIEALKKGILKFDSSIQVDEIIASDGGEGFLNAIKKNSNLQEIEMIAVDPLGNELTTVYGFDAKKKIAYIEMAKASGLELLKPEERNVLKTSTYGTGLQIKRAINTGATEIYIGLGGSATNDAGIGIASALGYLFLDKNNMELKPIGKNLLQISKIIPPTTNKLMSIKFYAVNDVKNPLFGKNGAAMVYGKQKGGDNQSIQILDKGLQNLDRIIKNQFNIDVAHVKGSGAAGGTAYGLKVFFNADFISGIDFILDLNKVEDLLKNNKIDLIITGEGKIDNQTLQGKFISGISKLANKFQIPAIAFCGLNELKNIESLGLTAIIEIADNSKSLDYNMKNASELLQNAVLNYLKTPQLN